MRSTLSNLVILGLLTSSGLAAPVATSNGPTVTVSSGPVAGTTTILPSSTVIVNKFLGIPFAQSPPVRFSPPTDAKAWTDTLDASRDKPACVQQFIGPPIIRNSELAVFNNPGHPPPEESEDCLYLNIYTPASEPPAGGRAVLFWIYGGNLAFGANSLAAYDGSKFASKQDVIVVTTNYRTNVFGFPNAPELPQAEQNLGFLDQRKALIWVQQNIAAFGGDPEKVTLFGESAGGYSVKQLIALPPADPLPFRAAILESQAVGGGTPGWESLVVAAGCALAPSQVECLRTVPAETIKSIIEPIALSFPPVVDNVTHVSQFTPNFANDKAARVPIILGTNKDEGRIFAALFGLANVSVPFPYASVQDTLSAISPGFPILPQSVLDAYPPPASDGTSNPLFLLASQILTDYKFTCPTSALNQLFQRYGTKTWRYVYNAVYPNLDYYPNVGAYHTTEIPSVFATYDSVPGSTKDQADTAEWVNTAWANFAKNPNNGPGEGWPEWGTNGDKDLISIDTRGRHLISQNEYDAICAVYAPFIAASGP